MESRCTCEWRLASIAELFCFSNIFRLWVWMNFSFVNKSFGNCIFPKRINLVEQVLLSKVFDVSIECKTFSWRLMMFLCRGGGSRAQKSNPSCVLIKLTLTLLWGLGFSVNYSCALQNSGNQGILQKPSIIIRKELRGFPDSFSINITSCLYCPNHFYIDTVWTFQINNFPRVPHPLPTWWLLE